MPIDPQEDPPIKPGQPSEPPQENPPGSPRPEVPPPMLLAAIGPKTLALAGQHFDGVVLHPFLTAEGVARSAAIVRTAAEEAGRDPSAVRIYAEVVVAPDASDAEIVSAVKIRAITYFTIRDLGGQLVAMNGWDAAPLERLRMKPL